MRKLCKLISKKGFTLVELIVAVGVMAVLMGAMAAIAIPVMNGVTSARRDHYADNITVVMENYIRHCIGTATSVRLYESTDTGTITLPKVYKTHADDDDSKLFDTYALVTANGKLYDLGKLTKVTNSGGVFRVESDSPAISGDAADLTTSYSALTSASVLNDARSVFNDAFYSGQQHIFRYELYPSDGASPDQYPSALIMTRALKRYGSDIVHPGRSFALLFMDDSGNGPVNVNNQKTSVLFKDDDFNGEPDMPLAYPRDYIKNNGFSDSAVVILYQKIHYD